MKNRHSRPAIAEIQESWETCGHASEGMITNLVILIHSMARCLIVVEYRRDIEIISAN